MAAAIAALNDRRSRGSLTVRSITAAGRLDRGSAQPISRLPVGREYGRSGRGKTISVSVRYSVADRKDQSTAVDDLLRADHVTVIRLPLDGGRRGSAEEATASVKTQLEGLLDLSMTLFLPRLKALVVEIDGERYRRDSNCRCG